jgi:uncharacterized protein (TIGR04222 family)
MLVNPFDWYGPEFLLFYVFFGVLVIGGMIWLRNKNEAGPTPKLEMSDPYLIAFLRGDAKEVLRVAMVSLVDRNLLEANGSKLKTHQKVSSDSVRHPVEKTIIENFKTESEASSAFNSHGLEMACEPYRKRLESAGLLPDDSVRRARFVLLVITILLLVTVALIKISIGLARERPVILLVILMIVAAIVPFFVWSPRLTARGKAALEDIQSLYRGLKDRAYTLRGGGATTEAVMLAAAFGLAALEANAFAYTQTLFPEAEPFARTKSMLSRVADSVGDSSWGSSCSSSSSSSCSSSSCGSSCGGGGCGGGCGGCGS